MGIFRRTSYYNENFTNDKGKYRRAPSYTVNSIQIKHSHLKNKAVKILAIKSRLSAKYDRELGAGWGAWGG